MQFMDLYVLEQKYDLERLESNRKIEDGNLIGLETISRLIERHFKEINVLRVSLGLDPLIRKPKFIED
ncbi:MAG: hypothetical protein HWD61_07895 [Parachlamydiaceae bacterium]|nr:MAG: hypothetical protein HWD61_07895 [Parachlamydiaceae bacterium]